LSSKLLLVEDDPSDLELILFQLRPLGAELDQAATLADARAMLAAQRYDCIVLDWLFAPHNATDFLRDVRRDHADVPIIVVTGADDRMLAERILQAGAQDFVSKNELGQHDLVRAVRYAVERQRAVSMQTRLAHADRLVSVGRLAAGIAHEVNNPATVLMTNLSVLDSVLGDDEPLEPALLRELVDESLEAITRISSIMRQLTGFSRQRSGGLVELPLHELLEEAVRLARPSMRHRAGLELESGLVPPIVVDRTAMVGVLVNLLVNAQQAVDRAPPDEHRIRVRLDAPEERIVLTVEDSGVGVPEAERDGIFDAFVTRRDQGLGLGLAICREVVRAHRGTIAVEDSELGGAAFVIRLPFDTGLAATEVPEVPQWTTPLDVLIVDDESNVRRAIVRLLGPHRVRQAASVTEAEAELSQDIVPDVILCDLMLDGELGSTLYRRLQRTAPELAPRVLFVTGGPVTPEAQAFIDEEAPPMISKPFSAAELRFGIQQLLTTIVARQSIGP